MKKDEFVKLALLGIASGMLTSNALESLQNNSNESNLLAKGCNNLASSCKSCNSIADKCGGPKGSCNAIADKCGGAKGSCNAIADKCGGAKGSCNAIADKCGGAKGGCGGIVAENDAKKTLTSPDPIPKDAPKKDDYSNDPNDQNIGYHVLTDEELTLELNDDTLKIYQKMSPEAKALTRLVASARCNKTNECRGLNACKTDVNDCAGKGACKGTGKCAVSDKNLAVKLVEQKMESKRQNLTR